MADRRSERRQSQRIDARMKLEVKVPLGDGQLQPASLETINISSSGIYFRSEHFIEPMTKLGMCLELPVSSATEGAAPEIATLDSEGIVVRVSPEEEAPDVDRYEIAVFFTHIEPEGLQALEEHITYLTQAS